MAKGQSNITPEAVVKIGVPQGDVLSPGLFSIYMDKLFWKLDKVPRCLAIAPANAFANDVTILAYTVMGLRRLLRQQLSEQQRRTCSTQLRKARHYSRHALNNLCTLWGANGIREEIRYPGISMPLQDATPTMSIERFQKGLDDYK